MSDFRWLLPATLVTASLLPNVWSTSTTSSWPSTRPRDSWYTFSTTFQGCHLAFLELFARREMAWQFFCLFNVSGTALENSEQNLPTLLYDLLKFVLNIFLVNGQKTFASILPFLFLKLLTAKFGLLYFFYLTTLLHLMVVCQRLWSTYWFWAWAIFDSQPNHTKKCCSRQM